MAMLRIINIVILSSLVCDGCAGYTTISVNCPPQFESASIGGGAAASCGTITQMGNTSTVTPTITATVPVAGGGMPAIGMGVALPTTPPVTPAVGFAGGIPQASVPSMALGAMVVTPDVIAATSRPPRHSVPKVRKVPKSFSPQFSDRIGGAIDYDLVNEKLFPRKANEKWMRDL